MATIYKLKPAFQNLLRPFVRRLAGAGVTANQVTVAGFIVSLLAGGMIAWKPEVPFVLLALPAALLLRMALNAIDGMLAREHGQKSRLGGVLNELGDVLSDAVLYLPLACIAGISAEWVVAFVILAMASEMAGVLVQVQGEERRYDGPMGKSDRAFVIGLLGLLGGIGVPLAYWANGLIILAALLLVLTIFNRVRPITRHD